MDFNPNKPPERIEWATYVPDRTTKRKFSTHKNRGHALNAAGGSRDAIVYRWDGAQWIEVARIEDYEVPEFCENSCGHTLVRYLPPYTKWIDLDTDAPRQITVCVDCARTL